MKEEFLHYLWKFQLFEGHLLTTEGLPISVKKPGLHNPDSGPDFIDALILIGDTLWAGNVEIHIQGSSWFEHQHHLDAAYDTVILHVVLDNNRLARHSTGLQVPTFVCEKHINHNLYHNYKQLIESRLWIPCARIIGRCPNVVVKSWLSSLMVERLHQKATEMESLLKNTNYDWEEALYVFLARSLGLRVNALPFELLASSVPKKILAKHSDNPFQIEALLFGQAGFLNENLVEPYPAAMKKEYQFLQKKYNLQPIDKSLWKFMRLRPAAFPTLRIAILAKLMASPTLFMQLIEANTIDQLREIFDVELDAYWDNHYKFGSPLKISRKKRLGIQSVDLLMINAIIPMLFLYGRYHGNPELKDRSIQFLEALPTERNSITEKWEHLGIELPDAATSQALLHLKKWYCSSKKCLSCRIGNELLRKELT